MQQSLLAIVPMFRQYLQQIATRSVKQVRHFVLGNSSVDYDSFFGSILLAYLLTTTTSNLHLPVIDCYPEQLHDRFQIDHVLSLLKIDASILKYRSALQQIEGDSVFNLYDHNVRKSLGKVEYIIDHHDCTNPLGKRMLISKMGSCLTHLYYLLHPSKLSLIKPTTQQELKYLEVFSAFIKGDPFELGLFEKQPEEEIEEIMRYGILIDTFNFDPNQAQRWTIFDKTAVELIEQSRTFDLNYQQLQELKFDQNLNKKLTLQAALNKDHKRYDYGGLIIEYSNVYLSLQDFVAHYREPLAKKCEQEQEGNIYIIMSLSKQNGTLRRALLFRDNQKNEKRIQMLRSFLESLKMKNLGMLEGWHWWEDPSNSISRKLFDKQLRAFYSNYPNNDL